MSNSRYASYIIITAALCSLILTGLTSAYAQNDKFRAKLDGNNEIPPAETPAEGTINFKTNSEGVFSWKMNITGITDATGAHIHQGTPTENGDVVVDLLKISKHKQTPTGMIMRGNVTDSDLQGPMQGKTLEDLKTAMSSGNTYVNAHTADNPDGTIRGQIKMKGTDESPASTPAVPATTEADATGAE